MSAGGSDNLMAGDVAVTGGMQAIGHGGSALAYGGNASGGGGSTIGGAYGGNASAQGGSAHDVNVISLFAGNGASFCGGEYGGVGFAHADDNTVTVGNDVLSAGAGFDSMAGDVYVNSMFASGTGGSAAAYGGIADGGKGSSDGGASAHAGDVCNVNAICARRFQYGPSLPHRVPDRSNYEWRIGQWQQPHRL